MDFVLMTAQDYRGLSAEELEERRLSIAAEAENVESAISTDDLEAETSRCLDEISRRSHVASLRNADMSAVLSGAGKPLAKSAGFEKKEVVDDIFATKEYERAFMDFVTRGIPVPAEYRENIPITNVTTTTSDASAVIPTTLMNEIITKAESYGDIWAKVRKLNIQGGVEFPVMSLKPVATWIGESEVSPYQKLQANQKITFSYFGLECRLAQTLLSNITALPMFNAKFVELATEAMIRALEQAIIRGTGTGQPLGIINDTRIPEANAIELEDTDLTWAGWHQKVKAKMKKSYRNGVFIMAQATWDAYIDGMVDENGQPVARVNYGINGEELYRFMGKEVLIVEDDILPDFETADDGDVFCLFIDLSNYAVNSNLSMRTERWYDPETNQFKTKAILVCDGKLLDPFGVLVISKKSE